MIQIVDISYKLSVSFLDIYNKNLYMSSHNDKLPLILSAVTFDG